nr:phosphotransferase [Agromyces seonyuensis]
MPALVVAAARGPLEAVWRNGLGGLTFRDGDRFLKWMPEGVGIPLRDEAVRLEWAGRFHPVPHVLAVESDASGELLVTAALPGRSAVDERVRADPAAAAAAIGAGLRALHEALPVAECPFDWSPAERGWALPHPSIDRLVVCHGDACAPNTLIGDDGRWRGHVDLGGLGVADRWADLAVASMSLDWNFGAGHEGALFAAYGIEPDAERLDFYRMLWNREDAAAPANAEGEPPGPGGGAPGRLRG